MRLFRLFRSLHGVSLLGLFACGGCLWHGSSSEKAANETFSFANDGGDLATHPIAAGGARTTIDVSGLPFTTVSSSAPQVAVFLRDGSSVDVVSGIPGTARLDVLDGRGVVLGSATVTVVATTQLAVSEGWPGLRPIVVAGTAQALHVATMGADGNITRGDGAVTFSLSAGLSTSEVPVDGDAIGFVGTVGTGSITASCPNATVTQDIDFVAPSDVTSLQTSALVDTAGLAMVEMVPLTARGPAYAEPCVWSASDPSVTLSSQILSLSQAPGTVGFFNLTRPGTFTVSCSMAGQTASVSVTRAL